MNVGELKEALDVYDDDQPVAISFDGGGTHRITLKEEHYSDIVYISEDFSRRYEGDEEKNNGTRTHS